MVPLLAKSQGRSSGILSGFSTMQGGVKQLLSSLIEMADDSTAIEIWNLHIRSLRLDLLSSSFSLFIKKIRTNHLLDLFLGKKKIWSPRERKIVRTSSWSFGAFLASLCFLRNPQTGQSLASSFPLISEGIKRVMETSLHAFGVSNLNPVVDCAWCHPFFICSLPAWCCVGQYLWCPIGRTGVGVNFAIICLRSAVPPLQYALLRCKLRRFCKAETIASFWSGIFETPLPTCIALLALANFRSPRTASYQLLNYPLSIKTPISALGPS